MKRFIQHDSLFIRHFTISKWPFPVHNHDHYELAFVHSGKGFHYLNDVKQSYSGPSLFLLAPDDHHIFEIECETEFSVLKFNNLYLDGEPGTGGLFEWTNLVDQLLAIQSDTEGVLVSSAVELEKIDRLLRLIVSEWKASLNSRNETIFYLIRSVFSLIKKNAFTRLSRSQKSGSNVLISLISYIHKEINHPDSLRLDKLASEFKLSPNQASILFRKELGVSVKDYIESYKLKIIEKELQNGVLSIKEISNAFGFSDLSHFNKFIRRHTGVNPKNIKGSAEANKIQFLAGEPDQ